VITKALEGGCINEMSLLRTVFNFIPLFIDLLGRSIIVWWKEFPVLVSLAWHLAKGDEKYD